jgi:hypothetical protein
MKRTISALMLCFTSTCYCVGRQSIPSTTEAPRLYELYSWQQPKGDWNFCLLPSPSGVNISAEAVFSEKSRLRGLTELKRKASRLTAGSRIVWMDRLSGHAKSEKLECPPRNIADLVRGYFQQGHLQLEVAGCNSPAASAPTLDDQGPNE